MENDNTKKSFDEWILLNVGGEYIQTTRSTLTKYPDSMLGKMFASIESGYKWSSLKDEKGAILIDQDPRYFKEGEFFVISLHLKVLNFLRFNKVCQSNNISLDGLLACASFFGISEMVTEINSLIHSKDERQVFHILIIDSYETEEIEILLTGPGAREISDALNDLFQTDSTFRDLLIYSPRKTVCGLQRCDFSTCEPARYRSVKVHVLDTVMLNHVTSYGWSVVNVGRINNQVDKTIQYDYWLQRSTLKETEK